MPPNDENFRFSLAGLVFLLALAPLARGAHPLWAALSLSWGFVFLASAGLIRSLCRSRLSFVWAPEDFWLAGGLGWAGFHLTRPDSVSDASDVFFILLGAAVCFLLARRLALAGRGWVFAFSLSVTGGLISVLGILQMLDLIPHLWWDPPEWTAATFVNHNHFAAYLEILLPIALLSSFAGSLRRWERYVLVLSSVLMGIGLVISGSRAAWGSFTVATAVVLVRPGLLQNRVMGTKWKIVLLVLPVLAGLFLMMQPSILGRLLTLLDVSNEASFRMRLSIWQGTWDLIRESPWVGHGLGSFHFLFTRVRPVGLFRFVNYAHNEYLQLVAELGVVGLVLLALAAARIARRARSLKASESPWKRALGSAGLWGLGSLTLHSFFDFPWHIPALLFTVSAVAGLVCGIPYRSNPRPLRVLEIRLPQTTGWNWTRSICLLVLTLSIAGLSWPVSLLIAADAWADRGQLNQAIRLAPHRAAYHERLAERLELAARTATGFIRKTRLKESVEVRRKVLALAPYHAPSAHALGEALGMLGEPSEAEYWLTRSVELDPKNPLYWKHWAEMELILGKPAEAAKGFRQAVDLARPFSFFSEVLDDLHRPEYFVQEGEAALLRGQREYAESMFEVARTLDPASEAAAVGLALTALKRGDTAEAQNRMTVVKNPSVRARWFSVLAQHELQAGRELEARAALDTALKLDPSNVLAGHLQLNRARHLGDASVSRAALDRLLAMNRGPVSVRWDAPDQPVVVWEPERGRYAAGHKIREGWSLFTSGSIQENLFLPPAKVRFEVTVSGSRARGKGPTMIVSWNGHPFLITEVRGESRATYDFETEVLPGESLLAIRYPDDLRDRVSQEDRNLRIHKVMVREVRS